MLYMSRCTAKRQVFNANLKLSVLGTLRDYAASACESWSISIRLSPDVVPCISLDCLRSKMVLTVNWIDINTITMILGYFARFIRIYPARAWIHPVVDVSVDLKLFKDKVIVFGSQSLRFVPLPLLAVMSSLFIQSFIFHKCLTVVQNWRLTCM